ncbi:TSC22 domain family protein 2-like isoform X2 [Antennarius striatus]|uniref:TSC22 domain family protein 2-like isoform X2 n=1 Tax=Antennarius striatus TaxID=241820 RepID=UPI0035B10BF0
MSKMPAKKKSCFQITSVTQAQVAAIGAADDTESLEDPDESRTEDVSSEIYDLPRAEFDPAGDRSSSEETLNNVGEPEVMAAPNAPQPGQLSSHPGGEFRKVAVSGSTQQQQQHPGVGVAAGLPLIPQPGAMQQQQSSPAGVTVNPPQPAAATSPAPPPATSTVSCTSRFRVIKLDHGIGEPFRRGRWTCTEFYDKDSDSSAIGRTVDSVRHTSAAPEAAPDRDSGLGHTGGSVVAPSTLSGQGSVADVSLSSGRVHPVEYPSYSARLQGGGGLPAQSAFTRPMTVTAQATLGSLQPSAPQSVLPPGQNGLPQPGVHTQKSPIMPPSAQPVTYHPQHQQQQQQHPMSHHLTAQSEYYQQQQAASMQPGQPLPAGSQSSGGTSGEAGGVLASTGQPGLLQQQQSVVMGGVGASMLTGAPPLQQQAVNQYAAAGQHQLHGLHPTPSGVQNVPAVAAVSSGAPAAPLAAAPSASGAASPNVTTSSFPPGQQPRSKTPVGLGAQGLPAAGFGRAEGGGGRSEDLINTQSPLVPMKEEAKPFMPESLQLATPTVNSLFGIHIPVDMDGDRASGTNVAAIDNKIEQAMDLVKSHLMYAVREEVEVLKEQIKELYERNSVLERENAVLKSLANNEQLSQLPAQPAPGSGATPPHPSQPPQLQQPHPKPQQQLQTPPDPAQQLQPNVTSA